MPGFLSGSSRTTPLVTTCSPWLTSISTEPRLLPCASQIATRIPDVFMVPFPSSAQRLLSIFEVFNLNIAGMSLPLSCIGLGKYWERMFFTLVFPIFIAAGIAFCALAYAMCKQVQKGGMAVVAQESGGRRKGSAIMADKDDRKSPLRVAWLIALPHLLTLSFLVFPMVNSRMCRSHFTPCFTASSSPPSVHYAGELRCIPSLCVRRV